MSPTLIKLTKDLYHNINDQSKNEPETTTSRQLKEIQNKTNSENRHLEFLIFKKEQENDGVGDISSLFQRHCQTK